MNKEQLTKILTYQLLTPQEKKITEAIEDIYIQHGSVTKQEFLRALTFLIKKYQR